MRRRTDPSPSTRPTLRRLALLGVVSAMALTLVAAPVPRSAPARASQLTATPATVVRAAAATARSPLAGRRWGVYKGRGDQAWEPFTRSSGNERRLLAKIALRPKAKWFGGWIPDGEIARKVDKYIANATGGNPDVLVQMTVFRVRPWEHRACRRLPTAAEQASYKLWIRRFARAVGSAHVALILQPDGPFALCAPGGSKLPSRLVGYAARTFAALPHTHVYIDAGASDWPDRNPVKAARILMPASIEHVRGFALNSTHYSSTAANIDFGTRLVRELARRGVPGKHFVINTSSNGRPFPFNQARGSHPDNAKACATRTERTCVTLGIPPTANVTSPRWRLSARHRARAHRHVDAYLWFGRPWLFMQADPFLKQRALMLARTTPF
ncbi:MAG TPA: glycoside hydrolase family 6 protein [Nocardioidaceae bacterium]|nr:glycoside hydrolase family 6 protein [Nocardioidaceae bacterium]